jgi:hypothetical protein
LEIDYLLAILQSLLAALGSIQFVSNIAFAYFVLNKTISVKYVCFSLPIAGMKITINTWNQVINEAFALLSRVMVATTFIVFGNIFLVSFGNHQSPGMGCSICYFYYT